jgi:hypothetical protein
VISEEKDYQKKYQWLKDRGDMTEDEGENPRAGVLINLPPTE